MRSTQFTAGACRAVAIRARGWPGVVFRDAVRTEATSVCADRTSPSGPRRPRQLAPMLALGRGCPGEPFEPSVLHWDPSPHDRRFQSPGRPPLGIAYRVTRVASACRCSGDWLVTYFVAFGSELSITALPGEIPSGFLGSRPAAGGRSGRVGHTTRPHQWFNAGRKARCHRWFRPGPGRRGSIRNLPGGPGATFRVWKAEGNRRAGEVWRW